jgi:dihydroorotate dehydrogenase
MLKSKKQKLKELTAKIATQTLKILPPETSHNLTNFILSKGGARFISKRIYHENFLQTHLQSIGILEHPISLAAGFDKNASCLNGLEQLNFAMLEFGAITPQPQNGHPKPRLFRYPESLSIINRMGFNNLGVDQIKNKAIKYNKKSNRLPFGANIGINKSTPLDYALDDYLYVINSLHKYVDYFCINISSPNTESLKNLNSKDFLNSLAQRIADQNIVNKTWIKLSPNLSKKNCQDLITAITEQNFAGVVLSNTISVDKPQQGGLSGHPLMLASTQMLEWAWEVHKGRLQMIGVGGILSGYDVFQKIIRGASAVQIYSAIVYRGPFVVQLLLEELKHILLRHKIISIKEAIGLYYQNEKSFT